MNLRTKVALGVGIATAVLLMLPVEGREPTLVDAAMAAVLNAALVYGIGSLIVWMRTRRSQAPAETRGPGVGASQPTIERSGPVTNTSSSPVRSGDGGLFAAKVTMPSMGLWAGDDVTVFYSSVNDAFVIRRTRDGRTKQVSLPGDQLPAISGLGVLSLGDLQLRISDSSQQDAHEMLQRVRASRSPERFNPALEPDPPTSRAAQPGAGRIRLGRQAPVRGQGQRLRTFIGASHRTQSRNDRRCSPPTEGPPRRGHPDRRRVRIKASTARRPALIWLHETDSVSFQRHGEPQTVLVPGCGHL